MSIMEEKALLTVTAGLFYSNDLLSMLFVLFEGGMRSHLGTRREPHVYTRIVKGRSRPSDPRPLLPFIL